MVKVAVEKLLLATFLSFSFENENSFIDFLCLQAASDVPSWYAGPIRPVEAFLQPLCTPGQLKKGLRTGLSFSQYFATRGKSCILLRNHGEILEVCQSSTGGGSTERKDAEQPQPTRVKV